MKNCFVVLNPDNYALEIFPYERTPEAQQEAAKKANEYAKQQLKEATDKEAPKGILVLRAVTAYSLELLVEQL